MTPSSRLFVLLDLFVIGAAVLAAVHAGESSARDASAEKLFRRKCVRCHDLRTATRPVRPEAADSLVYAMRRYDTRWIKTEEVPVLAHYVREYHARRNSPIQSHSQRSTP